MGEVETIGERMEYDSISQAESTRILVAMSENTRICSRLVRNRRRVYIQSF
jgi:hypothetical protein